MSWTRARRTFDYREAAVVDQSALLAERTFSLDDQQLFAELSGDWNPLHLDPTVARRSMFGQPVVHGIHAFLWALGAFLPDRNVRVRRMTVAFKKPILVDEHVEAWCASSGPERAELQVRRHGVTLLVAKLELEQRAGAASEHRPRYEGASDSREAPRELGAAEIGGRAGTISLLPGSDRVWAEFADLIQQVGADAVSSLMALSRLVGMECPGLHSLFSGFVARCTDGGPADELTWAVNRFDDRVGAVRMSVVSGALEGTVDAFVRPQPSAQPESADLRTLVRSNEFSAVRALVVGGSRGLGELTAKLLALGGGHVVLTWHRGASDATSVVNDIRSNGGVASAIQFDVTDHVELPPLFEQDPVTHLFYFATPQIFARRTSVFDPGLFVQFSEVYVAGFSRVVERLTRDGTDDLVAFYPSTVAIDENRAELREYAAAKAAGESVARSLGASINGLRVIVERLPRLPTDQTASILSVPTADPAEVMIELVRRTVNG